MTWIGLEGCDISGVPADRAQDEAGSTHVPAFATNYSPNTSVSHIKSVARSRAMHSANRATALA
jgi:hypothetical protein